MHHNSALATFRKEKLWLGLIIVIIGSLIILACDLYSPSSAFLACGVLGYFIYLSLEPVRPRRVQGISILLLAALAGLISTLLLQGACHLYPTFDTCRPAAYRAQTFLHFYFTIFSAITSWIGVLLYKRKSRD